MHALLQHYLLHLPHWHSGGGCALVNQGVEGCIGLRQVAIHGLCAKLVLVLKKLLQNGALLQYYIQPVYQFLWCLDNLKQQKDSVNMHKCVDLRLCWTVHV